MHIQRYTNTEGERKESLEEIKSGRGTNFPSYLIKLKYKYRIKII